MYNYGEVLVIHVISNRSLPITLDQLCSKTSWLDQNLSRLFLKLSTEFAEMIQVGFSKYLQLE